MARPGRSTCRLKKRNRVLECRAKAPGGAWRDWYPADEWKGARPGVKTPDAVGRPPERRRSCASTGRRTAGRGAPFEDGVARRQAWCVGRLLGGGLGMGGVG